MILVMGIVSSISVGSFAETKEAKAAVVGLDLGQAELVEKARSGKNDGLNAIREDAIDLHDLNGIIEAKAEEIFQKYGISLEVYKELTAELTAMTIFETDKFFEEKGVVSH